jgi:ABC-type antimicrobial peptide transport system permease subunit
VFNDLFFRLRSPFHRDTLESEADTELRFHFDQQVEKYIKSGLTREEALGRARIEFGGHEQLKEEIRDARGVNLIETVQERLLASLSTFFGGLALLLAMSGLYGAPSYLVAQRQREFGIRMALRAPRDSILRLVMRDVIIVLAGGLLAGTCLALATVSALQKMLFGLAPHDPFTFVIAIGVLSVVAMAAGYLPALRAMRVDPMVALRYV